MYLLFDTETTGFFNPKIAHNMPGQARICSIGAILVDNSFAPVDSLYTLIKPSGFWNMSEGAFKKHGITKEMCEKEGKELKEVMESFWNLYKKASLWGAFNLEFDRNMVTLETLNAEMQYPFSPAVDGLCLMEATTEMCCLPFANGCSCYGRKYKWPKLEEAYEHLFHEPLVGAHNALTDSRAALRILQHLVTNKLGPFSTYHEQASLAL